MQLNRFTLGLRAIKFTAIINPREDADDDTTAEEERKVTAHEEPLPELREAFGNLAPAFIETMALPSSYREDLHVYGFSISRTKNGTRAVQLLAKKALHTIGGQLHPLESPFVKIDPPADGESGEQQVGNEARATIEKALYEAERYVNGERSQALLDFDKAKKALNAQFKAEEDELQPSLM